MNYITYLGRYHNETISGKEVALFSCSSSGFDVNINVLNDKSLIFLNIYNRLVNQSSQFLNLYVDDVMVKKVELIKENETIDIDSLAKGKHIITLRKLNEAQFSSFGLISIDGEGYEYYEAKPRNKRRIEIYGDSISAGYGNLAIGSVGFKMEEEDSEQTYGALLAKELDFDYNIVAKSGLALAHSPFNDSSFLADIYDTSDLSNKWDMNQYIPEYVLLNIGTNDNTVVKMSTGQDKENKIALFKEKYLAFMKLLKDAYKDTKIICLANMMTTFDNGL